ncbi:MAG: hypothetical protein Q7R71_02440 [bacterium]|nr:hypothetical protein [bacterium]
MTIMKSRVAFPGFDLREVKETATHLVEVGNVTHEGAVFVLEMLRKYGLPEGVPFVIASIENTDGKLLWRFKQENFDGAGVLAMAGSEPLIALIGRGAKGQVERVVPFSKLVASAPVQLDLRRQVTRKRGAATFLNRGYNLTKAEQAVAKIIDQGARAAKEIAARVAQRAKDEATTAGFSAQKAANQAAFEARESAHKERVAKIMSRDMISVQTLSGGKRYGVPAFKSEWQSLPNGTFVVLVESIDKNGKVDGLVEAFQVKKMAGKNPEKEFATSANLISPMEAVQVSIEPKKTVVIERQGGYFEVKVFAAMDNIRAAQKAGLNGGTFVATEKLDDGKLDVYAVTSSELVSVGKFAPMEV